MAQTPDLSGYVDVATRIAEFRDKHPEGSLQPLNPAKPYDIIEVGGATFVVYAAAAYRTPDDQRPGVGIAQELIPGRTTFTKGSELQNAETSAWGRAIVAVLAADTRRGVASADEIRNRQAERDHREQPPLASGGQLRDLVAAFNDLGVTEREQRLAYVTNVIGRTIASSKELTVAEVKRVIEDIRRRTDPHEQEAS